MCEGRFWKTHEFGAVNARFLFEALFQTNADLRAEAIMLGVNAGADHGRKPRVNQRLAAYDDKDTLFARIANSRLLHQVQLAPLHGSIWYSTVS